MNKCKYCGRETNNPKYCSDDCWHKHSAILGIFKGKNNPFYGKKHTSESIEKFRKNRKYFKGKLNPTWKPPKNFICEECGESFEAEGYKRRKFCSKVCANNYNQRKKIKKIKKECVLCGKEFLTIPSKIKRKFCSPKCVYEGYKIGLINISNIRETSSKRMKEMHKNLEFEKKRLRGVVKKPNKKEILLDQILQLCLPSEYKYVGNGEVILGGKNPDFINCNGQKKLIELFGNYWHSKEITGMTKNKAERERIEHFKQYSFDTLVIWENELENQNELIEKLKVFNNV